MRIILNGKKAGIPEVRQAVEFLREESKTVEVRVTWEKGDVERLLREAVQEGVKRVVAGGGDGTVNEVVAAVMGLAEESRPEVAILPLGTANDFATACRIPTTPRAALNLAADAKAVPVDVGRANDRFFINVASGGFGAQVTAETPVELKNFLGGGAYTLMGVVRALNFSPYNGTLFADGTEIRGKAVVGAVCNGRQAGGGQEIAPDALIDDGLLDIVVLLDFPAAELGAVIREVLDPTCDGRYVKRIRAPWVEYRAADAPMPINLDGEPIQEKQLRFETCAGAVKMVLPPDCPCLASTSGG